MKKITLEEALKYFSLETLETMLSEEILQQTLEEKLESKEYEKTPLWINDRGLVVGHSQYGSFDRFSNRKWIYYVDKLAELKPKKLIVTSYYVKDFSGIEKIQSLEELEIGNDTFHDRHLYISDEEIKKLLSSCLLIRSLKKLIMFAYCTDGGSIASHTEWVKKIGIFLSEHRPGSKVSGYYPINVDLP